MSTPNSSLSAEMLSPPRPPACINSQSELYCIQTEYETVNAKERDRMEKKLANIVFPPMASSLMVGLTARDYCGSSFDCTANVSTNLSQKRARATSIDAAMLDIRMITAGTDDIDYKRSENADLRFPILRTRPQHYETASKKMSKSLKPRRRLYSESFIDVDSSEFLDNFSHLKVGQIRSLHGLKNPLENEGYDFESSNTP